MSIFFSVVSVVWLLAHLYLGRRLIRGSVIADRRSTLVLAWAVLTAMALLPLLSLALRQGAGSRNDTLAFYAFTSMGMSTLLLAGVIAVDALRLVRHLWRRVRTRKEVRAAGAVAAAPVDPDRRRFFGDLGRAGLVGGAGGLTAVGYVHATRVPPLKRVDVPVADLPAALDGYTIVQLSDVHIGPTIKGPWLREVVAAVNALEPDMIAVTGDIVDGFVEHLAADVAPLADLRARDGAFYVTGNHEYYWDGAAWTQHFATLGLRVMTNAHALVERGAARLLVGGVTDIRGGHRVPGHSSDPHGAIASAPAADVKILLAHQPRSIFEAAKAGWNLQLSGHTHGGQYLPFSWMIGLFQPYAHGLHRHAEAQVYVSRGTGYWGPPNRFGSTSEISVLTLRRT